MIAFCYCCFCLSAHGSPGPGFDHPAADVWTICVLAAQRTMTREGLSQCVVVQVGGWWWLLLLVGRPHRHGVGVQQGATTGVVGLVPRIHLNLSA
jgi:hypothetical protein